MNFKATKTATKEIFSRHTQTLRNAYFPILIELKIKGHSTARTTFAPKNPCCGWNVGVVN